MDTFIEESKYSILHNSGMLTNINNDTYLSSIISDDFISSFLYSIETIYPVQKPIALSKMNPVDYYKTISAQLNRKALHYKSVTRQHNDRKFINMGTIFREKIIKTISPCIYSVSIP